MSLDRCAGTARRWLTWALLLLIPATIACGTEELDVYYEIPSFSLTDQLGRNVTSDELRDRVVLANFIFTNCTEFCLTLTPRMAEVQERLEAEGILGHEVALLSFSVDPEYDTSDVLLDYAERYGADHEAWRFLTGSPEEMERLLTDGFKVPYTEVPQTLNHVHPDGSVHVHEYNVVHTNRLALVDGQGQVRAYYDGAIDWDLERVLLDIRRLAG